MHTTTDQLHIRSIHPDDIAPLHALLTHPAITAIAPQFLHREYSQTVADFQSAQAAMHRLVGVVNGQVVAYGWLRRITRPRMQHTAHPGLFVHPDFWGRGIGRRLFAALLDLADNWLRTWRLELPLDPDNSAARHLAEAAGFVAEGVMRQATFGNGRFHDAILYARLLHPPASTPPAASVTPQPLVHVLDAANAIIRPPHPDDVDDMSELFRHPLVARTTLQLPSQEVWATRQRLGAAPPPGLHRLVAEDDGRAVGMITIYQQLEPHVMHSAGLGMSVRPDYWGLGIGSRLMAAIIDLADNWLDLKRIELDVNTDNPAGVHLYQKFGFEIEGTRRYHARGDGRWADSYFMARLKE
jgi:L-phenylalanine/L-methionine N-acetyltransferase